MVGSAAWCWATLTPAQAAPKAPTLAQIQELQQLVVRRVRVQQLQTTQLSGRYGHIEAILEVHGDVLVSIDLQQARKSSEEWTTDTLEWMTRWASLAEKYEETASPATLKLMARLAVGMADYRITNSAMSGFVEAKQARAAYTERLLRLIDSPASRIRSGVRETLHQRYMRFSGNYFNAWQAELEATQITPWTHVRPLLNTHGATQGDCNLVSACVRGNTVYALVLGLDGPRAYEGQYAQVIKISLTDGSVTRLSKLPTEWIAKPAPNETVNGYSSAHSISSLCWGDTDLLIVAQWFGDPRKKENSKGVYRFPLRSGAPVSVLREMDTYSPRIQCMASLGDTLIIAQTNLEAQSLTTGKIETIISPQRKEARSPFDDGPSFNITWMNEDTPRHRLLFFAEHPDATLSGLWEYRPGEGKPEPRRFRRILAIAPKTNTRGPRTLTGSFGRIHNDTLFYHSDTAHWVAYSEPPH